MPMQTETVTPTTDTSLIPKVVAQLREAFERGRTRPIEWRRRQLQRMMAIVEGWVTRTPALLAERFDYVFYTGNGRVGRTVMEAGAKPLTPVTLELGGKSPVIVDDAANVEVAARRIAFGKFLNAGQTCIAPDYVLVAQSLQEELVQQIGRAIRDFYGPDPAASPDYARIVNDAHVQRLEQLLAG